LSLIPGIGTTLQLWRLLQNVVVIMSKSVTTMAGAKTQGVDLKANVQALKGDMEAAAQGAAKGAAEGAAKSAAGDLAASVPGGGDLAGAGAGDLAGAGAGDLDLVAVGDLAGAGAGDLEAILMDLRGVIFVAAAVATRPVFCAFEGAALGDFLAALDDAALAGDASFAETGALDTPPLTADLGVFAGDFLAAAGDLMGILRDFPSLTFWDFAVSLPF
jgi:hypothetical protein